MIKTLLKCKGCKKGKPRADFFSEKKQAYRATCQGCLDARQRRKDKPPAKLGSPEDIKAKVLAYKQDCTKFEIRTYE